jgi:hypothetical protein
MRVEVRQHLVVFHMAILGSVIKGTSASTVIIVESWSGCVLDGLHASLDIGPHVGIVVGTRLDEFGFNPVSISAWN